MGRGLVEGTDLTLNRRTLLAAAAGGAAMAMGCGPGSETASSAPAAVNGWTPPDDERRRVLVSTARFGPKQAIRSANGIAICTHPLASAAAADMLALGGNACDGVMAASIAQAVVEPHMTTLSGCLSMLYYDAASGEYTYVNGMMAAPQAVPGRAEHGRGRVRGLDDEDGRHPLLRAGLLGWFRSRSRAPRPPAAGHRDGAGDPLRPRRLRDPSLPLGRDVRRVRGAGPGAFQPGDLLRRQHAP